MPLQLTTKRPIVSQETQKHLHFIDAAKGFAIIAVVTGHCLQEYLRHTHFLIQLIQSFHIPLFMFISGYLGYKITDWKQLKKKVVRLLIPFSSYALIISCIAIAQDHTISAFCHTFVDILLFPDKGLWFLWALFFIFTLFILIQKISNITHLPIIVCVVPISLVFTTAIIILKFQYFAIYQILRFFIYFAAGAMLNTYRPRITDSLEKQIMITSLIIFFITAPLCTIKNEDSLFYSVPNIGFLLPTIIRCICNISSSFGIFLLFKHIYTFRYRYTHLEHIGTLTLGIYFFHFLIIPLITHIWLITNIDIANPLIYKIVLGFWILTEITLVTVISVMIVHFSRKHKISATLFLGE